MIVLIDETLVVHYQIDTLRNMKMMSKIRP